MYRHRTTRAKSSLSIFAQKYLCIFEDTTYFILQNKYHHVWEDSFEVKILRDDCAPNVLSSNFCEFYIAAIKNSNLPHL